MREAIEPENSYDACLPLGKRQKPWRGIAEYSNGQDMPLFLVLSAFFMVPRKVMHIMKDRSCPRGPSKIPPIT
jgi:hypothetical protein